MTNATTQDCKGCGNCECKDDLSARLARIAEDCTCKWCGKITTGTCGCAGEYKDEIDRQAARIAELEDECKALSLLTTEIDGKLVELESDRADLVKRAIEAAAQHVAGLDCAHRCGIGHEIATAIRAIDPLTTLETK